MSGGAGHDTSLGAVQRLMVARHLLIGRYVAHVICKGWTYPRHREAPGMPCCLFCNSFKNKNRPSSHVKTRHMNWVAPIAQLVKGRLPDAGGLRFESQAGRVTGEPTPSLQRDTHPAIKGLRPPEHTGHARKGRCALQNQARACERTWKGRKELCNPERYKLNSPLCVIRYGQSPY